MAIVSGKFLWFRGSTIKYLRIPDEVLEQVRDDIKEGRKRALLQFRDLNCFMPSNVIKLSRDHL